MLLEVLVAAVIGISFGNAWACIFMSFGTSSEDRSVGKWFIAGRFLGLIFLGSVISLLRFAAQDVMPYILFAFGISTLMFGFIMLFKHFMRAHFRLEHPSPDSKKKHDDTITMSLLSSLMVFPRNKMNEGGFINRIKKRLVIFPPLLSNSLERSIQSAEAMESRGFGLKGKKNFFKKIQTTKTDYFFIVLPILLIFLIIVMWMLNIGSYDYYPSITPVALSLSYFIIGLLLVLIVISPALFSPLKKVIDLD